MEVDVQNRLFSVFGVDNVFVPDLVQHRLGGIGDHRMSLRKRSRVAVWDGDRKWVEERKGKLAATVEGGRRSQKVGETLWEEQNPPGKPAL